MFTPQELADFCDFARDNYLDSASINCVVFGFHAGLLKVLIVKIKNEPAWFLPGGFIFNHETIEMAANRILKERTGLEKIFLQQFQVFGHPERNRRNYELYKDMLPPDKNWFSKRFLSIGYYALVNFHQVKPTPSKYAESCDWYDLSDLPELEMDHTLILRTALDTLRLQLNNQPIGYNLMPEEFTMPELQKLYETILDKKLDRRNFQRRMLGFGILNRSEQQRKGGAHKAPYLYSFDLQNYQDALKEGFEGSW